MRNRPSQPTVATNRLAGQAANLAALVVLPLWLAACSQFNTELGKPLKVDKGVFVEGQTSVHTIIHELGPPNQVSALSDGFVFLYEHSQIGESQIGLSVNLPVLRFLKLVRARSYVAQDLLLMTFDDQGRLRGLGADQWKEDLGGGTAVQLLVSVIGLTDFSVFRRPADAHSWGAACLRQLPSTLNSDQNLQLGSHGLQLRSAPSYAGQQALEMAKPKKSKPKKRPKTSESF